MSTNVGSQREADTGQLARLMSYTIFHIGAYITLAGAALVGLAGRDLNLLAVPLGFFLVAGMAGSVIGSNLPRFATYEELMAARIGVGGRPHLPPARWMAIEHISFWAGLLTGLGVVAVG